MEIEIQTANIITIGNIWFGFVMMQAELQIRNMRTTNLWREA
jgi:hypothetical protein